MRTVRMRAVLGLVFGVLVLGVFSWAQKSRPTKPPVPPADPAITYVAWYGSGDHKDVMVVNVDGSNKRAVLSQRGVHYNWPDWSPDGKQLVTRGGIGTIGIDIVNVDGTGLRRVLQTRDWGPVAWSPVPLGPDQKYKIAFADRAPEEGRTDHDLYLINTDGTDLQRLTDTPEMDESPWGSECNITWSPTGQYFAAAAVEDVIVYEISCDANGVFTIDRSFGIIPPGTLGDIWQIDWANTQNKLVISAGMDLYIVDALNQGPPLLRLTNTAVREDGPSWSPDDSQIAFVYYGTHVWVMNANGTGVHEIVAPLSRVLYERTQWRRNLY